MGPIAPRRKRERRSALGREIRDCAADHGRFTPVMAADGQVWLIEEFGRRNVMAAVKGLVVEGIAEPIGLPKLTGKATGDVVQEFRLL